MAKQQKDQMMPPISELPKETKPMENNIDPTFAPNISVFKNLEQKT